MERISPVSSVPPNRRFVLQAEDAQPEAVAIQDFIQANEDFGDHDLREIAGLKVGDFLDYGGGAAVHFRLTRIADAPTPQKAEAHPVLVYCRKGDHFREWSNASCSLDHKGEPVCWSVGRCDQHADDDDDTNDGLADAIAQERDLEARIDARDRSGIDERDFDPGDAYDERESGE